VKNKGGDKMAIGYTPNYGSYNAYTPQVNPYGNPQLQQQMQQLQQMQQPQFQQPQQQINSSALQGQQVADLETVKGFNIPLDGTVSYFPATTGNIIYTKQLQLDGTVALRTYKLTENKEEDKKNDIDLEGYVTKDEFNKVKSVLDSLLESLGGTKNE